MVIVESRQAEMSSSFLLSRSSPTGGGGALSGRDAFRAHYIRLQTHAVIVTGKQFGGRPYRPWLQTDSDSEWLLGIVAEEKNLTLHFKAE